MIGNIFKSRLIIFLFFSLLFLGDTLTSLDISVDFRFSFWVKVVLSLILVINLIFNNISLLALLIISFCFFLIESLFTQHLNFTFKLPRFAEYYSGIMFFSFLFLNKKRDLVSKIYFFIFSIFIVTVLIATLFEIEMLKTYKWSDGSYT